jgi:hypothetical protein
VRRALIGGMVAIAALTCCVPPASADEDFDMAMDHRPILMFDSGERWRPLEINAFFAESNILSPPHRACIPGTQCTPVAEPGDLPPDRKAALDVSGHGRNGSDYRTVDSACQVAQPRLYDCDSGPRSAIYYAVSASAAIVKIDYWWFLRFNDAPNRGAVGCNKKVTTPLCFDHEGDWEGVRVTFLAGRPDQFQVLFDAHGRSEWYERLSLVPIGNRPLVYVARGTHASYPLPCRSKSCRQTGGPKIGGKRLREERFDGKASWGRNSPDGCASTCLLPLPSDDWATWPGLWGRKDCRKFIFKKIPACRLNDGPSSPALQSRSNPFNSTRTKF